MKNFSEMFENLLKPRIIKKLEKDHIELKNLLEKVYYELNNDNYKISYDYLKLFTKNLKIHFEIEDKILFEKLFKSYKDYEFVLEFIKKEKKKCLRFLKFVRKIASKYNSFENIMNNIDEFKYEIELLLVNFNHQIKEEENHLFILY